MGITKQWRRVPSADNRPLAAGLLMACGAVWLASPALSAPQSGRIVGRVAFTTAVSTPLRSAA